MEEFEQCMEGAALTQAAEVAHCSMGPAIQGKQVAHTHGSPEAVGVAEVDTDLKWVDDRRVVVVAGFRTGEVEYMQALLVAEGVDKWRPGVDRWRPGDEMNWTCSLGPVEVENSSLESDEVVARKKEKSRYLWFCYPGN